MISVDLEPDAVLDPKFSLHTIQLPRQPHPYRAMQSLACRGLKLSHLLPSRALLRPCQTVLAPRPRPCSQGVTLDSLYPGAAGHVGRPPPQIDQGVFTGFIPIKVDIILLLLILNLLVIMLLLILVLLVIMLLLLMSGLPNLHTRLGLTHYFTSLLREGVTKKKLNL